jgi:hypothetical protein
VYAVQSGPDPRYLYAIGLSRRFGAEVVLAGAACLTLDEAKRVIDAAALRGLDGPDQILEIQQGRFHTRTVHPSWVRRLLLGATDGCARS